MKKNFGEYIKAECQLENKEKDIFRDNADKFFEESESKEIYVMNFNYSDYLKNFVRKREIEMVNIHGKTDKPIFGIDYHKNEIGGKVPIKYTKTSRIFMNDTINDNFKLPSKKK